MSTYPRHVRVAFGAAVGLSLLLATACGSGGETALDARAASQVSDGSLPADSSTTLAPGTVPPTVAPTTTAKPVATGTAPVATPAPPAVPATAPTVAATTPTVPATAPPTTPAPATTAPPSTVPARPDPSSVEVQAATTQFRSRILLFSPTEAQARQFGDMVCDSFDSGSTYAQVKASALQQVAAVPFITVSSADADYILRVAVKLFCPAHTSKLP